MKTSEILIKARDLISDPARWTQKTAARNANGTEEQPELALGVVLWASAEGFLRACGRWLVVAWAVLLETDAKVRYE